MANEKAHKPRFTLFGYGAIALYVSLLALMAAGVYGFNLTSLLTSLRSSEELRAQMRTGQMVFINADRSNCRSVKFNNETAELSAEKTGDCDDVATENRSSGGSFSMFRNGFRNR